MLWRAEPLCKPAHFLIIEVGWCVRHEPQRRVKGSVPTEHGIRCRFPGLLPSRIELTVAAMGVAYHKNVFWFSTAWTELDVVELNQLVLLRTEECRSEGAGQFSSSFRRGSVDARLDEERDVL